jgi:Transposase IS200 like
MTPWLLTSTFYGQWLPGEPQGSVANVRERRSGDPDTPARKEHSLPGQEFDGSMPGLRLASMERLKGPPVTVDLPQAEQLLEQFQETATYRGWTLHAVSIMFNHIHLVVEAGPELAKDDLLRDFKSYGSRRLNRLFGERTSGTWWTASGSCRRINRMPEAIFYACHRQPKPLLVWSRQRGRIPPSESHPDNVYCAERDECNPQRNP